MQDQWVLIFEFYLLFQFFFTDITFWKSSARKIYTVSEGSFHRAKSSSQKSSQKTILEELGEIKSMIDGSLIIVSPEGLRRSIMATELVEPSLSAFKCLICQSLTTSPTCISICCKQILGCVSCVQQWTELRCPHCRNQDYSFIEVNAFESLLEKLSIFSS